MKYVSKPRLYLSIRGTFGGHLGDIQIHTLLYSHLQYGLRYISRLEINGRPLVEQTTVKPRTKYPPPLRATLRSYRLPRPAALHSPCSPKLPAPPRPSPSAAPSARSVTMRNPPALLTIAGVWVPETRRGARLRVLGARYLWSIWAGCFRSARGRWIRGLRRCLGTLRGSFLARRFRRI